MTTLNVAETRSRSVSLLLTLDRRAAKPLYQQIYDAYRAKILRKELRAGELVPSTRELARDLRVSRLPVLNAYSQLLAEGYFESKVGAGTFVSTSLPGPLPSGDVKAVGNGKRGQRPISAQALTLPRYETPTW